MHTEATKAKIKAAWIERKKSFIPPMKGKKMSDDSRQKMRDAAKKRTNWNRSGVPHMLETRALISKRIRERAQRGSECHSFKDGKLAERRDERFSCEYKRWRFDVFLRDKFTCQDCGDDRGGNLVAHHIKGFSEFPELRVIMSNGLTLCRKCHRKVHAKQ